MLIIIMARKYNNIRITKAQDPELYVCSAIHYYSTLTPNHSNYTHSFVCVCACVCYLFLRMKLMSQNPVKSFCSSLEYRNLQDNIVLPQQSEQATYKVMLKHFWKI